MNTAWLMQNRKGLTLVELMIVLVLSTLLMSAAYVAYQAQHKTTRVQEQVASMQQDLRAAMDIMEKDIHNAGCDPSGEDIAPLLRGTTGPHALGVQMDLAGNTSTGGVVEHVRYYLSNNNLLRNEQVLVHNVTTLGITYWNEDANSVSPTGGVNAAYGLGNTMTSSEISSVRSVQVRITLRSARRDVDTGEFGNRKRERRVRLRNW